MLNEKRYYHFTEPARLDKAINTLDGILRGITADCAINERELGFLKDWVYSYADLHHKHPFTEILPAVNNALHNGIITEDEHLDILWLCQQYKKEGRYYDAITADMQRLHGILRGIAADKKINEKELKDLEAWTDERDYLKTCWPYDEIQSLIAQVMADGKIDGQEHQLLLTFFESFSGTPSKPADHSANNTLIAGFCAVSPDISFKGKLFCFTGGSSKAPRSEIAREIESRGGIYKDHLVMDTNYLIIGGNGNPCWAYACYGRKVETAARFRQKGARICIVHENDFWDALS